MPPSWKQNFTAILASWRTQPTRAEHKRSERSYAQTGEVQYVGRETQEQITLRVNEGMASWHVNGTLAAAHVQKML